MKYYFLKHIINEGDIYIPFEYGDSITLLRDNKDSKLKKIPFVGKKETDYYAVTGHVISNHFKTFLELNTIPNIEFIPITFENKKKEELKAYAIKFTTTEDCIDPEKSDVVILLDTIREINKISFKKDFNMKFFLIKGYDYEIVVDNDMKEAMEKSNLKGISFTVIDENYKF
ncbi:imm11 family protein [Flavobacterium cerinum]|uniref:Immunity MXAN-0049 protein domain-containing protein n=1 Tax=Flavobacterium cerinum TaxID=2502784 RepID=A0ABY5INV6_9FLAO|nr:DUF1629 domain-containing protein [Flavobacterium cerinum]UUC44485.1 hypothetical protein NOX80_12690 [Flavobacterium cerinum]